MIHEVAGDILMTKAKAIARGVAPNDHFNNGLALELREQLARDGQRFSSLCPLVTPKSR